ncbi:uncharacterized protein LOC115275826 [Suricata suricatta]|uniref:uncharacterized protein LOC115275826 n=1 Tax=Suricata suricatta TaxID=37032 RepID=UPI0011552C3D|nr:uncharacterized protein LOC115275826 [Suricata suricatta]
MGELPRSFVLGSQVVGSEQPEWMCRHLASKQTFHLGPGPALLSLSPGERAFSTDQRQEGDGTAESWKRDPTRTPTPHRSRVSRKQCRRASWGFVRCFHLGWGASGTITDQNQLTVLSCPLWNASGSRSCLHLSYPLGVASPQMDPKKPVAAEDLCRDFQPETLPAGPRRPRAARRAAAAWRGCFANAAGCINGREMRLFHDGSLSCLGEGCINLPAMLSSNKWVYDMHLAWWSLGARTT